MLRTTLFLAALAVHAADRDWSEAEKLQPGQKLEIRLDKGESTRGTLESVARDSIKLTAAPPIAQTDVRRVLDRSRSKRARNALIGAAIGVGAGVALENSWGTYLRNEVSSKPVHWYLWAIPIGAGAALGSAIPSHPTIYRR